MPFKDVREFIDKLESAGKAVRIEEEVDWNLEAGAMLRRSAEGGLPAPFFEKIKGCAPGYRLFGGGAAKFGSGRRRGGSPSVASRSPLLNALHAALKSSL